MGSLPAGFVTFMFTDMEGSTRLHRQLGDDFALLIDEHDRLLSQAVTDHGGSVVTWLGDGLFAAFPEPEQAVAAAVDVQRVVAAHPWSHRSEVRVRIGLHGGQVAPQGRDYVALEVSQAARVAAAAHGGQVLVTQAVLSRVKGVFPLCEVQSLGSHLLRDFPDPIELHQISLPGASTRFPPLRTLDLARRSLPEPTDDLVGRHRELRDLRDRLLGGAERLVTLVGPAGVGKTRLAVETANAVSHHFPDGVWFARLDLTEHVDEVPGLLAASVGAPGHPAGPVAALTAWLRPGRQLLVADNWEQVLDAAPVVTELLEACPRLVVLATSQQRLRLRAEHVVPVGPLELPAPAAHDPAEVLAAPAAELFARRAMAIQPFVIDDNGAAAITRICRAVEGIPLAVELCAGRVDELPLDQLAAALDDQMTSLRDGPRDAPERHRSLHAALQWSYRLLPADQAAVLRRLAIFSGTFSLQEATGVCVDPDAGCDEQVVVRTLAELVDRSLLQLVDVAQPSYRLLDPVRQFLTKELRAESEYDRAARRLMSHLLRELGPEPPVFFEGERTLLAQSAGVALEWALSSGEAVTDAGRLAVLLQHFWDTRGEWAEGLGWLATARAAVPDGSEVAAALDGAIGWLHFRFGDHEAARSSARALLASDAAVAQDRGQALHLLAVLANAENDFAAAVEHAEAAQGLYRSVRPDHPAAVWLYRPLVHAAEETNDPVSARALLLRALEESDPVGDPDGRTAALRAAAGQHLRDGELAAASEALDEAEELARRHDYPNPLARTLHLKAQVSLERDDLLGAEQALDEALALAERLGSQQVVACIRCTQVELAYRQGLPALATQLLPRTPVTLGFSDDIVRQLLAVACVAALERRWAVVAHGVAAARAIADQAARPVAGWVRARLDHLDDLVGPHLTSTQRADLRAAALETLAQGGPSAALEESLALLQARDEMAVLGSATG